jgi:hypothetical protein
VDFADDPAMVSLARVAIPAGAVHGLIGLGVVARLNLLPLEIGPTRQNAGRSSPARFERAIESVRGGERVDGSRDYGALELVVSTEAREAGPVEYRLRFDRREFERSLLRLVDLFHAAWRAGRGVRLAL